VVKISSSLLVSSCGVLFTWAVVPLKLCVVVNSMLLSVSSPSVLDEDTVLVEVVVGVDFVVVFVVVV
jgi:hypothetical protein